MKEMLNKKLMTKPRIRWRYVLLLFLLVAVSPMLDIGISTMFYNNGQFYFQSGGLPFIMRKALPLLLVLIGMGVFAVWFWGLWRGKWLWGINTRIMLFVFGSQVVCVGLINSVFKLIWGRARPYEIVEFGGNKQFTPPMIISNQCNWDCSFISGHTVISFWALALALLVPHQYRKKAIIIALVFGIIMAMARVIQGFHFISDVVFGAAITIAIVLWMHYKLFPEDYS